MSMKVQTRQVDGITVLDLSGRITLGEGSVTIRDAVRDVLAKGSNKILLNLGDINYIDSSGIGELVSAFTTVKNSGGELKLLNLTPSELCSDQVFLRRAYLDLGGILPTPEEVQSFLADKSADKREKLPFDADHFFGALSLAFAHQSDQPRQCLHPVSNGE